MAKANFSQSETVRLLIEAKGGEGITDLQKRTDLVRGSIEALKDSFTRGDVTLEQFRRNAASLARQNKQLTAEVEEAEKAILGLTSAADLATLGIGKTVVTLEEAGKTMEKTSSRTSGLNMSIRGLGYGLSDVFSNNGPLGQKLQGFSNNVGQIGSGIASMLGKTGPAAIAAVAGVEILFTAVGALLTALDVKTVDDFFNLWRAKSPFKQGAQDIDGMKRSLNEANKELAELEKRGNLTLAQHERRNQLLKTTADLHRKITEEQKQQKELEELNGLQPQAQTDRAEGFKKAVGEVGGGENAVEIVNQALYNKAVASGEDFKLEDINKQAEELVREAAKGDKDSRKQIKEAVTQHMPKNQQQLAENIDKFSPETKANKEWGEAAERELAEWEREEAAEERQKAQAARKKALEDRKAQAASRKLTGEQKKAQDTYTKMVDAGVSEEEIVATFKANNVPLPAVHEDKQFEQAILAQEKGETVKAPVTVASGLPKIPGITPIGAPGQYAPVAVAQEGGQGGQGFASVGTKKGAKKKKGKKAPAKPVEFVKPVPKGLPDLAKAAAAKIKEKKDADKDAQKDEETKNKEQLMTLDHEFGKNFQEVYEVTTAKNEALRLNGAPVATNAKQEKRFIESGQEYALPPQVLQKRMQQGMFLRMKAQGASDENAKTAVEGITKKGDEDLMKRMTGVGQQGLTANAAAFNVAVQLNQEVQNLAQKQNYMLQQWNRLQKEVQQQSRGALRRGGR